MRMFALGILLREKELADAMFAKLSELYRLLDAPQRWRFARMQLLVIVAALAEIASVFAFAPFMAIVSDMGRLSGSGRLAELYRETGLASPESFLILVGLSVLGLVCSASALSMFSVWRLSMFSARVGAELAQRLFRHFLRQPWLFHSTARSSDLLNQIAQECPRLTNLVIVPLMHLIAKAILAASMCIALFVFNPWVAIVAVAFFIAVWVVIIRSVRERLAANSRSLTLSQQARFQVLNEGLGGIRDVLLFGRESAFFDRFEKASDRFADASGTTQAMSLIPRYVLEAVAFTGAVGVILYILATRQAGFEELLPVLVVYALAGFKIMPAVQTVYRTSVQIRGNLGAFDAVAESLRDSLAASNTASGPQSTDQERRVGFVERAIELKEASFSYPGKPEPALRDVSMSIPANAVVGFVGASGAGKSTALDLILGLIEPEEGQFLVDDRPLRGPELRAWQRHVGFVPQSIYLSDGSILDNVAFGLAREEIDMDRVRHAIELARLSALIDELPEGLLTRVGERGVQLSGGQRQRIGIARALYDDPEVLLLDEATSALDGLTEKEVMEAVHAFGGRKTVVLIAHRLSTVRDCDCIHFFHEGRVVESGRYEELIERNAEFRELAASG